ncbi:MAG: hypothetical protein SPI77_01870 [Corynebacterium sp.]|nr:hypothetical protein [Corynebacterium sp.]
MANTKKQVTKAPSAKGYVDPGWHTYGDAKHAVTELISHTPGANSPFGDSFVDPHNMPSYEETGYVHPYTRINK